jgi:MFS transporter, LPLT family, lysophospholipid transporter
MNALLQHRGYQLLTPGRSIAVQGFNENASVLVMLGIYAWTVSLEVPIMPLMTGFGLIVAGSMALIAWRFRRLLNQRAQRHRMDSAQIADGRGSKGL